MFNALSQEKLHRIEDIRKDVKSFKATGFMALLIALFPLPLLNGIISNLSSGKWFAPYLLLIAYAIIFTTPFISMRCLFNVFLASQEIKRIENDPNIENIKTNQRFYHNLIGFVTMLTLTLIAAYFKRQIELTDLTVFSDSIIHSVIIIFCNGIQLIVTVATVHYLINSYLSLEKFLNSQDLEIKEK